MRLFGFQYSLYPFVFWFGFCFFISNSCFAKNEDGGKKFIVSKQLDYQILFSKTGQTLNLRSSDRETKEYHQISYKVIPVSGTLQQYFGGSGVCQVRFKDDEGFVQGTDIFERKDFNSDLGYYGRIWMNSEKVRLLAEADLIALASDDVEIAQNERFRIYYELRQFIDMDGRFLAEIHPPFKFKPANLESTEEASVANTEVTEKQSPNDTVLSNEHPESSPKLESSQALEQLSPFGKEPITNEMVSKALEEFDKIPPTVVDSKQPAS